MIECIHCGVKTSNPKFCSRSCAAKYNNVFHPKRKPEGVCCDCQGPVSRARTRCKQCHLDYKAVHYKMYDDITLGEFQCYSYQRSAKVRVAARKTYLRSNKLRYCYNCGYKKHFEICHIKPIKSFPDTAKVSEVNSLDNLIALCPNCHWELDSGLLTVPGEGLEPTMS
jgi:5-methylcytosine-specific restriction endonuclease McrA